MHIVYFRSSKQAWWDPHSWLLSTFEKKKGNKKNRIRRKKAEQDNRTTKTKNTIPKDRGMSICSVFCLSHFGVYFVLSFVLYLFAFLGGKNWVERPSLLDSAPPKKEMGPPLLNHIGDQCWELTVLGIPCKKVFSLGNSKLTINHASHCRHATRWPHTPFRVIIR